MKAISCLLHVANKAMTWSADTTRSVFRSTHTKPPGHMPIWIYMYNVLKTNFDHWFEYIFKQLMVPIHSTINSIPGNMIWRMNTLEVGWRHCIPRNAILMTTSGLPKSSIATLIGYETTCSVQSHMFNFHAKRFGKFPAWTAICFGSTI